MDFGIARANTNEQKTAAGVIKGKVSYFSPEQLDGATVSSRSDQFSLGVVLWEMFCRTRLFMRENDVATLKAVKKCWVPAVNRLNSEIPPAVAKAIAQCTAKAARYRHPDCGQLAKILDQSLERVGGRLESDDLKRWLDTLPPRGLKLPFLSEALLSSRSTGAASGTRTRSNTLRNSPENDEPRTRIATSEMRELARLRSEDTSISPPKRKTGVLIGVAFGFVVLITAWLLMTPPSQSVNQQPDRSLQSEAIDPAEQDTMIIAPAAPTKIPAKKKKRSRRRRR